MLVDIGTLEERNIPVPDPGPGEAVVRVRCALTCGTDLKAFLRGHPKMPMPTAFGHEFSGVIAKLGPEVKEAPYKFKEGDAVMSVHTAPCNDCFYCEDGLFNLCTTIMDEMVLGAYAENVLLPAKVVKQNMFSKPPELTFEEAALLEPLSCVVYGMQQLKPEASDTVVVIGPGPIGLMYAMLAKDAGCRKVVVVGRNAFRLQKALELGADEIINVTKEDGPDRIRELTNGRGAEIVYECTGMPEVWQHSIDYVRPGGKVLLYGGCKRGTTVTWDTYRLHYEQISLKGVFHFTPNAVAEAAQILISQRLPFKKLITGSFPLSQLKEAFDVFQQKQCIKLAIIP